MLNIQSYKFLVALSSKILRLVFQRVRLTVIVVLTGCSLAFGSANTAESPSCTTSAVPDTNLAINNICSKIYDGNFTEARLLIEKTSEAEGLIYQLNNIITDYEQIQQKREKDRQAAFQKQLEELEKFQNPADTNEVNSLDDANGLVKILSTISKAVEFADLPQKKRLLSNAFVQKTFEKAIEKASGFEAEGKWIDAYTNCYYWLHQIDNENEAYAEYVEELLEKASILASFQDSPCETTKQRYAGVKEEMFIKAINALNSSYVSPLDYKEMAQKALRRCNLLAEVMSLSFLQISKSSTMASINKANKSFTPPNSQQLAAWSAGLNALSDELKQEMFGIDKDKFVDIFNKVLALNKATTELPETILIAQFAEGSLAALDIHSAIYWPSQVKELEKIVTNKFTGIGIRFTKEKGLVKVVSLLPDTPAYSSGLDAGDIIEAVDGTPTKDMSTTCVVKNITGPAGTKVKLTVRGQDEDTTRDITITRATIIVPPIRGWQRTEKGKWLYMIDEQNRIGYVRITDFVEHTADELEKVLTNLEEEGLNGLILDLRSNPGGLLDSAVKVVDKFIEKGLIVSTRPRVGYWNYEHATKKGTHPNYPLVILINRLSASASEIVAGALADKKYERAVLVGERTHGKGSVQVITNAPGGGAQLKYTIAYYHLPSGQKVEAKDAIQKQQRNDWGVAPDAVVEPTTEEISNLTKIQWDNEVLVKPDHDLAAEPLNKHSLEETLAADTQLAIGLLMVKTKLIEQSSTIKNKNTASNPQTTCGT